MDFVGVIIVPMSRHGSGGVEDSGDADNFIFAVVCVSADTFSPDSSLVADGFSHNSSVD